MSDNYQRNTTMVVCILAVLVIGAVVAGALTFFGSTNWGSPNWNIGTTEFQFSDTESIMPESVTLDIDLGAGEVTVNFTDDPTLLYDITIVVPNNTVTEHGNPSVTYTSNTITLDYAAGSVAVVLGSGTNYTLNVESSAGAIDLVFDENSHIGDVTATTTTGAIDMTLSDDVYLNGDIDVTLTATTGEITILADLPTGVGGSFEGSANLGEVDVTATGWTKITNTHYETSDYDTADTTITIIASTNTGGIDATLV